MDAVHAQLAEYDRAVLLANQTYVGMSSDERVIRKTAGAHLREHAPSNRPDPTCTGCDGGPWPCPKALGAIQYVDPRNN